MTTSNTTAYLKLEKFAFAVTSSVQYFFTLVAYVMSVATCKLVLY